MSSNGSRPHSESIGFIDSQVSEGYWHETRLDDTDRYSIPDPSLITDETEPTSAIAKVGEDKTRLTGSCITGIIGFSLEDEELPPASDSAYSLPTDELRLRAEAIALIAVKELKGMFDNDKPDELCP